MPVGLAGMSTFLRQHIARAPEKCCHGTRPGYTQFIANHNGSNPLVGGRNAWVTHIAHKTGLDTCQRHQEEKVTVFLLQANDLITRITLTISQMITEQMPRPVLGLWQIIAFHRPGTRGEMYLPRLLVPFDQCVSVWSQKYMQ